MLEAGGSSLSPSSTLRDNFSLSFLFYFPEEAMSSLALRLSKLLRLSPSPATSPSLSPVCVGGCWRRLFSSGSLNGGDEDNGKDHELGEEEFDEFLTEKPEAQLQGVDPRKGWGFRGVHKAIICGKVGQAPVQKILRNGRTVTIFTVGTGGMFDQRMIRGTDLPKPAQWHRIAIHNDPLGTYAVQQLTKNSPVYVEGDIETRVYNDSISGEVKSIPEICVRRDGRIRLIKSGETINSNAFDDLREGLLG